MRETCSVRLARQRFSRSTPHVSRKGIRCPLLPYANSAPGSSLSRSCSSSTLLIGAGRFGWLPADLFFRLDPLVGIAGMIAARQIVPCVADRRGGDAGRHAAPRPRLVWVVVSAGHGAGRHACAAQQALRADPTPRLRSVKYVLLALILAAALLGNLTFLILDPITLLYRTAATALWPALVALISGAETVLYRLPFLQGAIDRFEGAFRGVLLPAGTAGLRHGRASHADLRRHPGVERRSATASGVDTYVHSVPCWGW